MMEKITKFIFLLLTSTILSFGTVNSFAQTSIPGGTVNGIWTKANSPYNIQESIQIINGDSLIIEPGVKVNFQGNYKLLVLGKLKAIGTIADTIVFTAANITTGWRGIRFENTSTTNDSSKIQYCKLQYGKAASPSPENLGGALFFKNFSKAVISNCRISDNMAYDGGGIYCFLSSPIINNNIISNNNASYDGGGVYAYYCNSIINNNIISDNNTYYSGGGIYAMYSALNISNSTISYNKARYSGGINCSDGNSIIINNTISNNTASSGGGVYCNSGTPNISNNTISDNTGGGIYCNSGTPNISNNIISNNTNSSNGGGIYCVTSSPNINNNIISNNTASSGGGIYCSSGIPNISNNVISNNTASVSGGGAFFISCSPSVNNNSIVNNKAARGGALCCAKVSKPMLRNTILYGNIATVNGAQVSLSAESSDPNFYFCDVQGGIAAFGLNGNFYTGIYQNNIDSIPLFVSPTTGSGVGYNGVAADWSLQSTSACINKGDTATTTLATDKAGNLRVIDGRIDIGAYEHLGCHTVITTSSMTTFCQGDSTVLTANTHGASYLWNTGASTQSITVKTSGKYSVMVKDTVGCSATSAPITVKVNPLPIVSITASGATAFCQGDSVQLTASAASSYLWSDNTTTQSITVKSSGNYTVKVTDANGCLATSSATAVTVNPIPTATFTAGGAIIFCQGDSVKLTASTGSSYLWSNNATMQSITVKSSGNYTVKVTGANGCSATSSATVVSVISSPAATVTASGAVTFCQGDSVRLTASTGSSYLWSNNSITQNIAVKSSGNYTVKVTDANGCSATSKVTAVKVNSLPTALISSGALTICQGDSVKLTASAASSYLWSNNATTQSIIVKSAGDYTVKVTDANGCSATSMATSVTVNSLPSVTITAGGALTICQGDSVKLTASTGLSYLWSNNAITQNIAVKSSGNYTVKVTDANGCSATSTATPVTVNSLPSATITIDGNTPLCSGQSTTLTASTNGAKSFQWSGPGIIGSSNQSSVVVNKLGLYSISAYFVANGCTARTSASIIVNSKVSPVITVTPTNGLICPNDSVTLNSSGNGTFEWYDSTGTIIDTKAVIKVGSPGFYYCVLTDTTGCVLTSNTKETKQYTTPFLVATPSAFMCVGNKVNLNVETNEGSMISWQPPLSGNALSQIITSAGSYTASVYSCGIATSLNMKITSTNVVAQITETSLGICEGDSVVLHANKGMSSYEWTPVKSYSDTIVVKQTGSFTVKVADANGCSATSAATTVTVNKPPVIPVITKNGSTLSSSATTGNQWYLNGDIITGAISQNYTPTQNGRGVRQISLFSQKLVEKL